MIEEISPAVDNPIYREEEVMKEMHSVSVPSARLSFEAWDVTGTHSVEAKDIQASLPVSAVASSLAVTMNLPKNVPYGLRDDGTSEFLDDDRPIGDQVEPDSTLTITPKTHLG